MFDPTLLPLENPFDTRSTNNVGRGWKIFVRSGRGGPIHPIKLAFRRFWPRFEKFGIVVSRGGRLASFCHTHQPFRETDGFETVVNGWERGGAGKRRARVSVCKEFVPSMPQTFAINHRFPAPPSNLLPLSLLLFRVYARATTRATRSLFDTRAAIVRYHRPTMYILSDISLRMIFSCILEQWRRGSTRARLKRARIIYTRDKYGWNMVDILRNRTNEMIHFSKGKILLPIINVLEVCKKMEFLYTFHISIE